MLRATSLNLGLKYKYYISSLHARIRADLFFFSLSSDHLILHLSGELFVSLVIWINLREVATIGELILVMEFSLLLPSSV